MPDLGAQEADVLVQRRGRARGRRAALAVLDERRELLQAPVVPLLLAEGVPRGGDVPRRQRRCGLDGIYRAKLNPWMVTKFQN